MSSIWKRLREGHSRRMIIKVAGVSILGILILSSLVSFLLPVKTYAATKGRRSYVYYDFDDWRRYISTAEPNCRHKSEYGYRYVEADQHSIFCQDCGVIFGYEYCTINNDRYSAPLDYYHDRCLYCLHKTEYVYTPPVKDKSGRTYID